MNKKVWALALTAALFLSGCSLAKPEKQSGQQDRLAGVYLVPMDEDEYLPEDENWVERGADSVDTEFGNLNIPHMILPGTVDREKGTVTFPGVKGYALAAAEAEEDGVRTSFVCNDMECGNFAVNAADSGNSYELSGTLYVGAMPENTIWHAFEIYWTPEGMLYIDGKGNSYSGVASDGFGLTLEQTIKTEVSNGEPQELTTKLKVNVERIPPVDRIRVQQYRASGELLEQLEPSEFQEVLPVRWNTEAAWAVVEESGPEGIKRTAISRTEDEEPESYQFYYIGEELIGIASRIEFQS